ncbi:UNVERIFIED_CONTAM: hypothetical protein K2H54_005586 [Gekko kuhli]
MAVASPSCKPFSSETREEPEGLLSGGGQDAQPFFCSPSWSITVMVTALHSRWQASVPLTFCLKKAFALKTWLARGYDRARQQELLQPLNFQKGLSCDLFFLKNFR